MSDGHGHWRKADGTALPQFDGCVDIDLAGTPFTNTLPIRRLGLTRQSGTARLNMLYVPFAASNRPSTASIIPASMTASSTATRRRTAASRRT